jgi:alpha-mannosidase
MGTIHVIPHAHIDPVWLWPWQAGLDVALATCRSACERLEAHPDLTFCQGEAWVYREMQRCDPELFARIERHVKSGRWSVVGGWWIQPDCNGPSGWAMERQIRLGMDWFQRAFGLRPRCGFNVDTFGHAAPLPTLMRAHGQDRYVMMRPQEQEMRLPARLFRWREREGAPEVTTFRIAHGYNGGGDAWHLRAALTELPPGCEHTMYCFGVGDHGGGPTEHQIATLRAHGGQIDGWTIEFSTPDRFFEAVARSGVELPLVTGELQMHAIGCYSVHREVKVGVRRAEHLLLQAELAEDAATRLVGTTPAPDRLREGWEQVCFNHFHDTYGGTCIPSAEKQTKAQLGRALALADESAQIALRRIAAKLPGDERQQLVFLNASDAPFDGLVELEPFLDWMVWQPHWRLIDEQGRPQPHQLLDTEFLVVNPNRRVGVRLQADPGQVRVLRIDTTPDQPQAERPAGMSLASARIGGKATVSYEHGGLLTIGGVELPLPWLELYEDFTDTWTHSIDRYRGEPIARAEWEPPRVVDHGPLMASFVRHGRIGSSRLIAEWRVFAEEPGAELRLRVHWCERHRLLKLVVPLDGARSREDGVLGGALERAMDGRELPLRDRSLIRCATTKLGVVAPDCFACDGSPDRLRLTLLRAPIFAHHDPHSGHSPRARHTDQGEHEFRFRFLAGDAATGAALDGQATMLQRPPLFAEVTRGMLPRR